MIDPILDDDVGRSPAVVVPAKLAQSQEVVQQDLFKTPDHATEKKPRFNLSELDEKQKAVIP